MNKFVKEILGKQCEIIGIYFTDVDFDDDLWFMYHQWTKDQEKEFIDWLTNYLRTNKDARDNIMKIPSRSKSMCKRTSESFAFNYGWKYK